MRIWIQHSISTYLSNRQTGKQINRQTTIVISNMDILEMYVTVYVQCTFENPVFELLYLLNRKSCSFAKIDHLMLHSRAISSPRCLTHSSEAVCCQMTRARVESTATPLNWAKLAGTEPPK